MNPQKKMYANYLSWFILFMFTFIQAKAQENPYHISNEAVYDFIDELANKGIIDASTCVKPYSRKQIALFLSQAQGNNSLTTRQSKEVEFYLKDFNKELFSHKDFDKRFDILYHADSTFKVSANVILGGKAYYNSNGLEYHRWNGAEFHGSAGKNIAFYASLRDNYESQSFSAPQYLSQHPASVYKLGENSREYSETRGGFIYSWKSGHIGIVKDNFVWGNSYNGSNIFSGLTPSFAHIKFNLKPAEWLEINYVHGWLASNVIDSTRSYNLYGDTRWVYANKYIASNLYTFRPWKKLYFSFGNNITYSDGNVNPAYLIPFLFYKSVDHTYNNAKNGAGHNSQMFFDISSRQIKKLHLYASLFVDEISINNMFDKTNHSNFVSIKGGVRATDLLPNVSLTAEYTRTNPFTYTHFIPSLTYETNDYTLGHYLRDNAEEAYIAARYKPIRGLDIQLSYTIIRKGEDNQKIREESGAIENLWGGDRRGYKFIANEKYRKQAIKLKATYQIINDAYIFAEIEAYDLSGDDAELYTPKPLYNSNNMAMFGINFGF